MTSISAVVVDDEQLALDRMADMLLACDEVQVVGSAVDAHHALNMVVELKPDVVFLDIEMPGLDGFDVVERLSQAHALADDAPLIVFVTAHPNFAPQAFETGAVDFLGKPVRLSRLEMTLARVRKALLHRESVRRLAELQQSLDSMRRDLPGANEDREHLWIQRRGEFVRLDIDDVTMIRAEAEYVRLVVGSTSYLHRDSIGAFEARLDPHLFLRIHRSTIVRRSEVVAIRRSLHGGAIARLASGDEMPIGRKYAKAARNALLGGGMKRLVELTV